MTTQATSIFLVLYLRVGLDEGVDSGGSDPSVNTRSAGLSTALTPRNKTDEGLGGVDDGASRVTLARVLSTSFQTSTEHVGRDDVAGVQRLVL